MDNGMGPQREKEPVFRPRRHWSMTVVGLAAILAVPAGLWMWSKAEKERDAFHASGMPPSLEVVRVAVQRAVDPDVINVKTEPRATSLSELRLLKRPEALNDARHDFSHSRIPPLETQVWRFRARIVEGHIRSDNDIYLVVEADGHRGCVEAPDPKLCTGSPFYSQIAEVRSEIESKFKLNARATPIGREAWLTGIGYFGTGGLRENGARLNPLLKVEWIPSRS